ncbi:hypothetical protein DMC30DRAFT_394291 [Rhodotorula diobovata]|uniref:SURP motif domain-containing protein n=1 Tax=Rhodotorula diobovata TaxID=5288 RepID=A0A5C5FXX6_9BASI|nr:hypothetical protein DMC30DRAFT_394291 [Rhodotorula diobovata]
MRRLDATLSSSPNPALLEMRILANHGADPRFAFLRPGARGGRWREVWERMRRGERVGEEEGEEREEGDERGKGKEGGGMAGLAAYGSSDEEEEDEVEEVAEAKGVDDSAPPAAEPRPAAAADIVTSAPEPAPPGAPPASPPDHAPDEDDLARLAKREARALRAREWARRRREAREGAPNDAA